MEVIKKTVQIESLISREHSLIPSFYFDENGEIKDSGTISSTDNWGKYTYDIDLDKCQINTDIFGGKRVTFLQMVNKYHLFRKMIDNSVYYKRITKNGVDKWVVFEPLYVEKIDIPIVSSFDEVKGKECGLYLGEIEEQYDADIFKFLMRAMGLFAIPKSFIKDNNGVPELMYYTGIIPYMNQMDEYHNVDNCSELKEYEFLGGDEFYSYLSYQYGEMQNEIKYWKERLYKDKYEKPIAPNVSFDICLNADYHTMGMYSAIDETTADVYNYNFEYKTFNNISRLNELRETKRLYCDSYEINENGERINKTELMPFILDDDNKTLILPYIEGKIKNIKQGDKEGTYYGDFILKIEPSEDFYTIRYVIGGELIKNDNGNLTIKDNYENITEVDFSGVLYEEKREKKYYSTLNKEIKMLTEAEVEINILPVDIEKEYFDTIEEIEAICKAKFFNNTTDNDYLVIMDEYNFGKIENLIENTEDVFIDRGFVSAFELHYKLGEINTLEDMENYQNNYFGL